jgi:hypothetical protein
MIFPIDLSTPSNTTSGLYEHRTILEGLIDIYNLSRPEGKPELNAKDFTYKGGENEVYIPKMQRTIIIPTNTVEDWEIKDDKVYIYLKEENE